MNLLEDDKQCHDCLMEATRMASPFSIRILFCSILMNCHPSKPDVLFSTFEEAMKLFDLPRTVGVYKGEEIVAAIGRFGPYLRFQGKFTSIKKNKIY